MRSCLKADLVFSADYGRAEPRTVLWARSRPAMRRVAAHDRHGPVKLRKTLTQPSANRSVLPGLRCHKNSDKFVGCVCQNRNPLRNRRLFELGKLLEHFRQGLPGHRGWLFTGVEFGHSDSEADRGWEALLAWADRYKNSILDSSWLSLAF